MESNAQVRRRAMESIYRSVGRVQQESDRADVGDSLAKFLCILLVLSVGLNICLAVKLTQARHILFLTQTVK